MKLKITHEDFVKAYEKTCDKLIEPTPSGQWFEGSAEECEEWAGDVFFDALEIFANCLGVEVEEPLE